MTCINQSNILEPALNIIGGGGVPSPHGAPDTNAVTSTATSDAARKEQCILLIPTLCNPGIRGNIWGDSQCSPT